MRRERKTSTKRLKKEDGEGREGEESR